MIKIIGLGTDKEEISLKGFNALKKADYIIFRTNKTKSAKWLFDEEKHISLDYLYDSSEDFEQLLTALVDTVKGYEEKGSVCYLVDGDGIHDRSVALLSQKSEVEIYPSVSRENATQAQCESFGDYIGISAYDFVSARSFLTPRLGVIIKEIDNKYLASEVKLKLIELFGAEEEVYLVNNGKVQKVLVEDIDRLKGYCYSTTVLIPHRDFIDKKRFGFEDLAEIIYRLRDKDGCPWDREQTHDSIKQCCIEESYELMEAINLEDVSKMEEETGDVLLQGIFHAIIAESEEEYSITDVLTVLCLKLINRHTHIFGNVKANDVDSALDAWETAKAKEKKQTTFSRRMEEVAPMPALMKAEKIQRIAKKANFEWENVDGAVEKVYEEMKELLAEDADRFEEGGDLLFSVVNVLRFFGIEPEMALQKSVDKFRTRFTALENEVLSRGLDMTKMTLEELDEIYNLVKKNAKN